MTWLCNICQEVDCECSSDLKVKSLIKQFNYIQDSYLQNSYDLLKQIYDIRKEDNKEYNITDLENERGLEQHKEKIRPLLKFSNVSQEVRDLQEQGKLNNSQVFLLANLPKELQTEEAQLKIAQLLRDGIITHKDLIGQMNQYKLMKMININKKMGFENMILLGTVYNLKTISQRIMDNKELLSTPTNYQKLKESVEQLNRIMEEVRE